MPIFIATQLTTVRSEKRPVCPSTNEWTKKTWCCTCLESQKFSVNLHCAGGHLTEFLFTALLMKFSGARFHILGSCSSDPGPIAVPSVSTTQPGAVAGCAIGACRTPCAVAGPGQHPVMTSPERPLHMVWGSRGPYLCCLKCGQARCLSFPCASRLSAARPSP